MALFNALAVVVQVVVKVKGSGEGKRWWLEQRLELRAAVKAVVQRF